jgi:hypothetical protein
MVQPTSSTFKNPISTFLNTLATIFETSFPEPTIEFDSDIESTDPMPIPHVFMMNPENLEENVEDPIIEEGPEFETPPEIPTFDSFSHSNIHTQGFSFDTIPPSNGWINFMRFMIGALLLCSPQMLH